MVKTAVVNGAQLKCSMGVAPSKLVVLPTGHTLVKNQPLATVNDYKPNVNIMPFGMCQSPANPMVAAATAAALGVLAPMPCLPMPAGPWISPVAQTTVGGLAVLGSGGTCPCAYGGVISIQLPGAVRTTVK